MPRRSRQTLPGSGSIYVGLSAPPEPRRRPYRIGQGYETVKRHRLNRKADTLGGLADEWLDHFTLWDLRELSRKLIRDTSLADGVVNRAAENIISTGYTLQPRTSSRRANIQIDDYMNEWFDEHADLRGKQSFWDLLYTGQLAHFGDGDVFWFLDQEGRAGRGSIMPIEADRCVTPSEDRNNERIVNGVRLSRKGEPLAYFFTNRVRQGGFARRDDGRWYPAARVLHHARYTRFSQTRGVPIFSNLIREIDDLDQLLVAVRVANRLAASVALFIKKNVDPEEYARAVAQRDLDEQEDGEPPRIEGWEPGEVLYGEVGEEIQQIASAHPGQFFKEFVELICRFVGLPLGLPLELVLLEFMKAFSASRMALEQAKRSFKCHQARVLRQLRFIYRFAIDIGVRGGDLPDRPDIYRHEWITPGWNYIEPTKDSRADIDLLKAGLTSKTEIKARRGESYLRTLDNRDREEEEEQRRARRRERRRERRTQHQATNTNSREPETVNA